MRNLTVRLNKIVSRYFLVVVVVGIAAGLSLPDGVSNLRVVLPYLLATIVFTMGTSCTVESFKSIIVYPRGFITALILIFVVMPLIGFAVGSLFYAGDPELLFGHVLVAVVPVAVTSVVWTGIAKGDIALSIALVTFVTLISGAALPLQLSIYVGQVVAFDAWSLVRNLTLTIVLPAMAGLLVRNRAPRLVKYARPYMDLLAKLGMTTILLVNGSVLKPVVANLGWGLSAIVLVVAVQVVANFAAAFGISALFLGRGSESQSAVMYSSSMRNNAAGLVIASNYVAPAVALPVIGSLLLQHFVAGLFGRVVRRAERRAGRDPARES
mgnify:FL=1